MFLKVFVASICSLHSVDSSSEVLIAARVNSSFDSAVLTGGMPCIFSASCASLLLGSSS